MLGGLTDRKVPADFKAQRSFPSYGSAHEAIHVDHKDHNEFVQHINLTRIERLNSQISCIFKIITTDFS